MSEHRKQTEFLRQCLRYDGTAQSRRLQERIAQIQTDERRVWRGLLWMAGLVGVAVVGLGYSAVFLAYYPETMLGFTSRLVTQVFCVLGLVAAVCSLAFLYLGRIYRKELNARREECRHLITQVMESRLDPPASTHPQPVRANPVIESVDGTPRGAGEFPGNTVKIESSAQG